MVKIKWPAGTLLAPLPPALISSGSAEKPNIMTAAWTGIVCSDPVLTYVSIRPSRLSHEIISQTKSFVINVPNLPLLKAVDFCGVKSGRTVHKFEACGLKPLFLEEVGAPQIAQAPISLACQVLSITPYGTHDMFLAEVKAVYVDDQYLNEKGALCLEKAGLLAYAHGFYYTLGRQLGKFGFSVEKPKTIRKRRAQQSQSVAHNARQHRKGFRRYPSS